MKIRPRQDRIIVKRDVEDVSTGGICMPETRKEKPITGRIVDCGPDVGKDLATGARVVFGQYAGTEVVIDRKELLMLRDNEVAAVLEDESPAEG
ncbi:MAG: co-chaperone GroES [bacterium]